MFHVYGTHCGRRVKLMETHRRFWMHTSTSGLGFESVELAEQAIERVKADGLLMVFWWEDGRERFAAVEPECLGLRAQPEYRVSNARYAKGQKILFVTGDGSGFKVRAHRLAEYLKGRWTGRESGYVLSPRKAERFEQLYREGYDVSGIFTLELIPPQAAA